MSEFIYKIRSIKMAIRNTKDSNIWNFDGIAHVNMMNENVA